MLSEYQKNILDSMNLDLNKTKEMFYFPSDVLWKELSDLFLSKLNTEGIMEVQSQSYNTLFSLIHGYGNYNFECSLFLYYNYLKCIDKYGILDKTQSLGTDKPNLQANAIVIPGRPTYKQNKLLTWDYLISIDTILKISEYIPEILTDPLTICELGAGWGRIAYYLTQINNKISYNIFDIPNVLIISHEYLRRVTKHISANEYRIGLSDFSILKGINFYTTNYLEFCDKKCFDIFINVASFQEMTLEQIAKYFEKIDYLSKYLYTQQKYEFGQMGYDKYPVFKHWIKFFDDDVTFHPLWFHQLFKC